MIRVAKCLYFPKVYFYPKTDFYPKVDIDILSEKVYKEQINLIKYLARMNMSYIPGCDYWNLVGEGSLAFATAVKAWRQPENPEGFRKYVKTAIYNQFFHVARYQKSRSKAPLQEIQIDSSEISPKITSNHSKVALKGFDQLHYKDLTEYVLGSLTGKTKRKIFSMLVDPPPKLMKWAFVDHRRKLKKALITGRKVKGSATFRFSERHVFEYLRETEKMDAFRFNSLLLEIREQVRTMIRDGDFSNQTMFGF